MSNSHHATIYLANALNHMRDHVLCRHYHRDGRLRIDKVMFDLLTALAHTIQLLESSSGPLPDPPTLSHSEPQEPD